MGDQAAGAVGVMARVRISVQSVPGFDPHLGYNIFSLFFYIIYIFLNFNFAIDFSTTVFFFKIRTLFCQCLKLGIGIRFWLVLCAVEALNTSE